MREPDDSDDRLYEAMNARRDEMAWDERYERFYMASRELAEELQGQAVLEDYLHRIRNLRDTESSIHRQLNGDPKTNTPGMVTQVREWLQDHPEERLYDNERGFVGYLQSAGEGMVYDPPVAIAARNQGLHDRLWELGCFVVDGKRVQECIKDGLLLAHDIAPYRHEVQRTPVVKVEKKE